MDQLSSEIFGFTYILRLGEFSVELYWKHASNTCRNFAELARRGYYNGTVFHRIIPGNLRLFWHRVN
jgi:cyclophilin family peptidyl-prolyl cis-trans isomerase